MNKTHKRVKFNRINPLSVSIALVIGLIWACTPGEYDDVYVAEPVATPVVKVEVKELTKAEIELKIKHYFKKSHATMIPIAYAESGMKMSSINWNCYYNKDETIVYETRVKGSHGAACKKEHRKYAFGVDCFVLQAHYPNRKDCPKDVTIDQHLQEMAELSKKRNFQPWVAWQNGSFKKYLASK
jgi:hypothetical protein